MIIRLLLIAGFICFLSGLQAQAGWTNPCGTVSSRSPWLKRYQADPESYPKAVNTILYVPLTIHLVGTDNGDGYFSVARVLDDLCTLNADFMPAEIQFFIEGDIHYIPNSFWNAHPTVVDGAEMMFANNVANTINCYFVADPAGNCGYNLPYAGIAIKLSCASPSDHTWAHEMGHALSLPHPFLGWEGGVSWDNSVPHNFNDPAPTTVLYDYTYFKDTLILDTMIIDTAYVELVDGSNCLIAADGFCDTSPDYLSNRWTCDGNSQSPTVQHDPLNAAFRSDGTLIMSYSDDACANRFSTDQMAAMRANLLDEKPNLLYNQTTESPVAQVPGLLSPSPGESVPFDQVELAWEPIENATQYLVSVSRLSSFPSSVTKEYITSDPQYTLTGLDMNKTYYWRVRAYNSHYHCTMASSSRSFTTSEVSAVNTLPGIKGCSIFPNLVASGEMFYLELNAGANTTIEAILLDAKGVGLQNWPLNFPAGQTQQPLQVNKILAPGMYFLQLIGEKEGQTTLKLIIR